jgi:hypothetical protein
MEPRDGLHVRPVGGRFRGCRPLPGATMLLSSPRIFPIPILYSSTSSLAFKSLRIKIPIGRSFYGPFGPNLMV